jgi:hypothetical protein
MMFDRRGDPQFQVKEEHYRCGWNLRMKEEIMRINWSVSYVSGYMDANLYLREGGERELM